MGNTNLNLKISEVRVSLLSSSFRLATYQGLIILVASTIL